MAKQMTFVAAMRDYFGLKPGQTPADFLREMKELGEEDKTSFKTELSNVGYEIVASKVAA
ncbi:MAG: hypothetical protein ACRECV_13495 [Xanthobacteraceae bacterium]